MLNYKKIIVYLRLCKLKFNNFLFDSNLQMEYRLNYIKKNNFLYDNTFNHPQT